MDYRLANRDLSESWALSLHGLRLRTQTLYRSELDRFADWLAEHDRPAGAPGDLLRVTKRDVEAWIGDQQAQGRAQATIRSRWIALRNFYGWLVEEEEIERSPVAKVVVAQPKPPPIEVISEDHLRLLFKVCEGPGFYERRDTALIRLLLATGVRASELCGLEVGDIELTSRLMTVDGKGGKVRVARFDTATASALDRYKRVRARHRLAALPELWIGHRGPVTRKGLGPILDKRCAQAGIGHVHPHQLRHSFAHRFLAGGGTEGDLQKLGGWEDTSVMRRYGASLATDRALAAYDSVNPMGKL